VVRRFTEFDPHVMLENAASFHDNHESGRLLIDMVHDCRRSPVIAEPLSVVDAVIKVFAVYKFYLCNFSAPCAHLWTELPDFTERGRNAAVIEL
jgi:hypothetical protein